MSVRGGKENGNAGKEDGKEQGNYSSNLGRMWMTDEQHLRSCIPTPLLLCLFTIFTPDGHMQHTGDQSASTKSEKLLSHVMPTVVIASHWSPVLHFSSA